MADLDRIVVLGAGGHAKVVIEAALAERPGRAIALLDDDPLATGRVVCGQTVLGTRDWLQDNWPGVAAISAVGRNAARAEALAWLRGRGRPLATVIHPAATVSPSAVLAEGCFVAAGAVINAEAALGEGVIVNTAATVDHDCRVGAAAHLAPGSHLCGAVSIGTRTLVGAGASVIPARAIGQDVVIGAGSAVIRDVPDGARIAGVPARPLARD